MEEVCVILGVTYTYTYNAIEPNFWYTLGINKTGVLRHLHASHKSFYNSFGHIGLTSGSTFRVDYICVFSASSSSDTSSTLSEIEQPPLRREPSPNAFGVADIGSSKPRYNLKSPASSPPEIKVSTAPAAPPPPPPIPISKETPLEQLASHKRKYSTWR